MGQDGASIVPTPDGLGCWARNGQDYVDYFVCSNMPLADFLKYTGNNVFGDKLGDARFHGSMGGQHLNRPVMAMAPTPNGKGYWLVASDGGIFAFNASFYGSMGSVRLNRPVVGIVASATGHGYLMVGSDGGIFTFGDVPFHGSLGNNPPSWPITSVAVMP